MKHQNPRFLILSIPLILMSCSNSDEKIIKEYMSANMNDPSSYESIELKVINNDTSILSQLPEIQEKLIKL